MLDGTRQFTKLLTEVLSAAYEKTKVATKSLLAASIGLVVFVSVPLSVVGLVSWSPGFLFWVGRGKDE